MEEIETNEYYEVEKLTHSIPYLIPSAAQLLEDIGHNFQDSLRNLNASVYKIKVTSVTRTVDDVKNLKKEIPILPKTRLTATERPSMSPGFAILK